MKLIVQIAAGILLAGAVAAFVFWAAQSSYSSMRKSQLEDQKAAAFTALEGIKSLDEIKARCGKPFFERPEYPDAHDRKMLEAGGRHADGIVLSYNRSELCGGRCALLADWSRRISGARQRHASRRRSNL